MEKINVLITGANSGIGYATTKHLVSNSERYHVIMACRSLAKADAAKAEIEASGIKGSIGTVQLDVTDDSSVQRAAKVTETKIKKLDVLFNNAGLAGWGPDFSSRFRQAMDTNVLGPFLVTEAFRPLLLKSADPRIIYNGSALGSFGELVNKHWKGAEIYKVSKAALNMVACLEWDNFQEQGLKMFVIEPGLVRSNLRGTKEEEVSAGGRAGDPEVSAQLVRDVIEGKRDADVGKFVQANGTFPW